MLKKKLRVATVFSGIGAVEQALKRMDIDHEIVFACDNGDIEIDIDSDYELRKIKKMESIKEKKEYADELYRKNTRRTNFVKQSYLANYDLEEARFYKDIRLLDGKDYENEVDLLVGGSPCQSFSSVGFQRGLEDTRGTLFYDFARLLNEIHPKMFIYENVRGLINHDKGNTWEIMRGVFDSLNYNIYEDVLNAKDYGVPQTRRRVFVVGVHKDLQIDSLYSFPPEKVALKHTMQDYLLSKTKLGNFKSINSKITLKYEEGYVDPKYILSDKLKKYVMSTGTKGFYQKVEIDLPIARTVLASMGNRHRAGVDNYTTDIGEIRMLTEREAHRLMGFDDTYDIVVSRAQGYRQAGNSIVVDVLVHILEDMLKYIYWR